MRIGWGPVSIASEGGGRAVSLPFVISTMECQRHPEQAIARGQPDGGEPANPNWAKIERAKRARGWQYLLVNRTAENRGGGGWLGRPSWGAAL